MRARTDHARQPGTAGEQPADERAALDRAEAELRAGRLAHAEALFRGVLARNPRSGRAHSGLGGIALASRQEQLARDYLNAGLQLGDDRAWAHDMLAAALVELGEAQAAEHCSRRAVEIDPEHAEYRYRLGEILHGAGRDDEAQGCFEAVLRRAPAHFRAHTALANLLRDRGSLAQARAAYAAALRIKPDSAIARWNLGLLDLLEGDLGAGWAGYAHGFAVGKRSKRRFRYPRWDGGPLQGRRILVYAEQGIGDEIMFASCVGEIAARADGCVLECDPRLGAIFRRSFPAVTVCAAARDDRAWEPSVQPVDVQCAAGDLPAHLRPDPDSFPRRAAYLRAEPGAVRSWRAALRERFGGRAVVGVSWRGGLRPGDRAARSIPRALLPAIVAPPGTALVCAQYDAAEHEVAALREAGVELHWLPGLDPMRELDAFAAMLSALDLLVCVDNSTAHLACALGRPTWIALAHVPDWRWMLCGEGSPWYPAARLFRQPSPGSWRPLLDRLSAELAAGGLRGGGAA